MGIVELRRTYDVMSVSLGHGLVTIRVERDGDSPILTVHQGEEGYEDALTARPGDRLELTLRSLPAA